MLLPIFLCLLSVSQEPAPGNRHALLVGCTNYPQIEEAYPDRPIRLAGPGHDVELFARTLETTLDVPGANIKRLVGWPEDADARPTRANILNSLDALAESAKLGDWICVYLAGHGTQQAAASEEEVDGFDEIFLPADAGARVDSRGRVPNGILDDEIGERLAAIRKAGADVWFVADCCHSGSLVRGEQSVVLRGLPTELFAPAAEGRRFSKRRGTQGLANSNLDGLVAMYAVQSDQKAPEMRLPKGQDDSPWHGLFTYLLCRELTRGGAGMTYDELHERVVASYQAFPYRATVPSIEGHRLRVMHSGEERGAPALLGNVGGGKVIQFNLGQLAGVEVGALVELFAADSRDDVIAVAKITSATPFDSLGVAVDAKPNVGLYSARVSRPAWSDAGLNVVLLDSGNSSLTDEGRLAPIKKGFASLEGSLRIVDEIKDADWLVICGEEEYWVRPSARTGGLDLGGFALHQLAPLFKRIVKSRGLVGLAAISNGLPSDLELTVERRERAGAKARPLGVGDSIMPGEEFLIRLTKTSDAVYDVTVLYLDASFGVTPLFPRGRASARLVATAKEAFDTGWLPIVDSALGSEHILVLAVPRSSGDPSRDFTWLAKDNFKTRSAGQSPLEGFLQDLASGNATRGMGTESFSLDHAIVSLRTEWTALQPAPWRRTKFIDLDPLEKASSEIPFPVPGVDADRMQRVKIRSKGLSLEMALVGRESGPETFFFDLVQGGATSNFGPPQFDAEAAFRFSAAGNYAYYDQNDTGQYDLVLLDADGDGTAETIWASTAKGWERRQQIAIPWLSQAHLEFITTSKLSIGVTAAFGELVENDR